MTTLHQIGELLRSGVRPTDEETEHLKALGGFVAEMYGRFMGGHAEHLKSSSDLWAGKLARRLSAATGARWEQGLGLAELLLGSELTNFWQIAREGFATGYGDFGGELGMVDLYEEDAPEPVAESMGAAPKRRRGSLFGAQSKAPAGPRKTARGTAPDRVGRQQLTNVGLAQDSMDSAQPGVRSVAERVREPRDAHWRDGSRAEMTVIRALAAGGLFVGDQVESAPRKPQRTGGFTPQAGVIGGQSGAAPRAVVQAGAEVASDGQRLVDHRYIDVVKHGGSAARADEGLIGGASVSPTSVRPVFLDGVRIDGRTPALAAALGRVDTVFGRGATSADIGSRGAAISQSRISRMTTGVDYSIDRGLGTGDRPVYGFYDAVETTYLNLRDEGPVAAADAAPVAVARGSRARVARTMPASMQETRRAEHVARPLPGIASAAMGAGRGDSERASHSVSLEQVVNAGGGALRPFVAGVFSKTSVNQSSAAQAESISFASQVTYLPSGQQAVRLQRGGMSAPRYAVVEAGRPAAVRGGVGSNTQDDRAAGEGAREAGKPGTFADTVLGTSGGVQRATSVRRELGEIRVSAGGSLAGNADDLGHSGVRGIRGQLPGVSDIGGGFVLASLNGAGMLGSAVSAPSSASAAGVVASGDVQLNGAGSSASARSEAARGGSVDWRLAIDGGGDLPLGATFSRHEVFAGTRASQGAGDMRATRNDFRPVIAGGDSARPSELAQALDGMVWVTLPTDSEPMTAAESMGLSAVPSRRRAAMVPAGLALQSIAGVVASARRSLAGSPMSMQALLEGGSLTAAEVTLISQATQVRGPNGLEKGQISSASAQGIGQASDVGRPLGASSLAGASLVGGISSITMGSGAALIAGTPSVSSAGAGAIGNTDAGAIGKTGAAVIGNLGAGLVGNAGSFVDGIVSGQVRRASLSSSFDSSMFVQALRSGFLGNVAIASVRGSAMAAEIGSVETPTFAAVAARADGGGVSLAGRQIEAALRADGVERGLRAARFLDGAVRQGGYGRIDGERELLSIAMEPAAPTAEGGEVARVRGGSAARRLTAAAIGRAGTVAATLGQAEIRQGAVRPQASAASIRASHEAGGREQATGLGSMAFVGAGESADARISNARVAMSRAVVTARESRAVASLFHSLNAVALGARSEGQGARSEGGLRTEIGLRSEEGASPAARDNMLRAVAARGFSEGYKGADEPILGRLVQRMNTVRAEQPIAIANWEVPPAVVERLVALEVSERRSMVRALSVAGWSQPEFEMLRIESPNESAQVEMARSGAMVGAQSKASVQQTARAARMSRSMARVLAGGEALGGAVDEKVAGAAAGANAQGQAASWLPLLSTGADSKYFGGLAPAGGASRVASLKQALGDLVKMAEAAVASSDTPVALAARREVLRRASALETQASAVGDRASFAQVMAVAAASRAAMSGGAEGRSDAGGGGLASAGAMSLVGELGGRASARVGGEQIRGFEDNISGLGALADGPKIGTGFADVAQRVMEIGSAEREMIELEREVPAGLEERLAKALAMSTSGPAGARRMVKSMSPARLVGQPAKAGTTPRRGIWSREPDEAAQVRDTVLDGASPERLKLRAANLVRQEAAVREEKQRAHSVMLGSVIAPEAMLAGLRSPEFSDAIRAVIVRRMSLGEDFAGVLTTLADSGVDLTAARSSISAQVQGEFAKKRGVGSVGERVAEMGNQKADFQTIGPGAEQFRVSKSALALGAPDREMLEMFAETGDLAAQVKGSMGRRQRAGLLSAILRGTERAELTAVLEHTGGRQFAMAWLNRVDGSRSGIDIGMKGTRQEFGQTFGVRRDSAAASQSAMGDARFVDTSERGEDKSGLRSIAASVVHTSTGAARPQHGASQAMRRTDWSFVDTGSKASTTHADLGKLASAIVGGGDSGGRAPMPLVAPAAKAIAQTALRDDKNSSNTSNSSTGGSPPPAAGSRGPTDAKMSEKAVEMLAIEMANRVARLMGLTNERRGIWS